MGDCSECAVVDGSGEGSKMAAPMGFGLFVEGRCGCSRKGSKLVLPKSKMAAPMDLRWRRPWMTGNDVIQDGGVGFRKP